jgi:hypothetical protein
MVQLTYTVGSNGNMNMLSPPVTPVSGAFPGVRTSTGNLTTHIKNYSHFYYFLQQC